MSESSNNIRRTECLSSVAYHLKTGTDGKSTKIKPMSGVGEGLLVMERMSVELTKDIKTRLIVSVTLNDTEWIASHPNQKNGECV